MSENGSEIANVKGNDSCAMPREIQDQKTTDNLFVTYLNSHLRTRAVNKNAIAEFEGCNPFFSKIHVEHPLVKEFVEMFQINGISNIILTGHAGDGKTTIAQTVYRHLSNMGDDGFFERPLNPIEKCFLPDGSELAVIKDLSEWSFEARRSLFDEILTGKTKSLLISNTGCLLDSLTRYAELKNLGSRAEWEPKILTSIGAERQSLEIKGAVFQVINLSLFDNLGLARQIFKKAINPDNFAICRECVTQDVCPILRNIDLLNNHDQSALERIMLAYRRMYEYGTRLTLRQLLEHISYLISSGLECSEIRDVNPKKGISKFLFFNRFFGDDGIKLDKAASPLQAICEIREQGFGEKPCPRIERDLWLLTHRTTFKLGVDLVEEEFQNLLNAGRLNTATDWGMAPDCARNQVRRMIFFLHEFNDKALEKEYFSNFLNSLSFMDWISWQIDGPSYSSFLPQKLKEKIVRVLQEQFSGTRLPEVSSAGKDHTLYITISRRKQEIRQSAQVVIAQIDSRSDLSIEMSPNLRKGITDIVLKGSGRLEGIVEPLPLPFLDYVMARQMGEIGDALQPAYSVRLEKLRTELIGKCPRDNSNELLVVYLDVDNTFKREKYICSGGRLEVSINA